MISADQLNDLARRAAKDSICHGYKDNEYPTSRILIKAACEVAEAIEAKRRNKIAHIEDYEQKLHFAKSMGASMSARERETAFILAIKDTVQDELADVIIYLLVAIGHFQRGEITDAHIDRALQMKGEFKETFDVEQDFIMRAGIVMKYILRTSSNILDCIVLVEAWLNRETGEDVWYFVREKMEFNKKRPYLHGFKTDGSI